MSDTEQTETQSAAGAESPERAPFPLLAIGFVVVLAVVGTTLAWYARKTQPTGPTPLPTTGGKKVKLEVPTQRFATFSGNFTLQVPSDWKRQKRNTLEDYSLALRKNKVGALLIIKRAILPWETHELRMKSAGQKWHDGNVASIPDMGVELTFPGDHWVAYEKRGDRFLHLIARDREFQLIWPAKANKKIVGGMLNSFVVHPDSPTAEANFLKRFGWTRKHGATPISSDEDRRLTEYALFLDGERIPDRLALGVIAYSQKKLDRLQGRMLHHYLRAYVGMAYPPSFPPR